MDYSFHLHELINEKTTEVLLNKEAVLEVLPSVDEETSGLIEKCLESRFFFHALYLVNIKEVLFRTYRLISDFAKGGADRKTAEAVVNSFVILAEKLRETQILSAFDKSRADFYDSLSDAVRDYENGYYKKALTELSNLSSSEMPEAHFYLGKCYYDGHAVKKNIQKAVQCFTKGVIAGSSSSIYYLGMCFMKGDGVPKNPAEGLKLIIKAAELGEEDAVFTVGCMYKDGTGGVEADIKKSIDFLQKSADYGNWSAAISICELYYEDAKTTGNFRRTSAARARIQDVKDPGVCLKIAQIYESGIGVPVNIEKALNFSAKAAAKNYPGATEMMTRLGNRKLGR